MNFDKQLDVFSRNLSEIRRNGRYSYQSFSEKLRVGKSTVQAIESGDYNITRQPVWSGTYAPCSAHTGAPAASHYCRPSLRVRLPPVPRSVS